MEATGSIHRRLPQVFLLPFCLALVIVNIALQRQNSKLAASLEDVRYARGPQQGGTLQQLSGLDALGRPVTFNLAMQKNRTLLLVLSARCGACTENWPKWRDVVRHITPAVPVVYADVADSVSAAYLRRFDVPQSRFLTKIDLQTRWIHDLRETPQTIVLGPSGRIEKVWLGVLARRDVDAIVALLRN
jgi:hypothetical protein